MDLKNIIEILKRKTQIKLCQQFVFPQLADEILH